MISGVLDTNDIMWSRYGLFFLLRDMGTLTDDFGGFVAKLAAARSPAYQLKLVNAYRLPEVSHHAHCHNVLRP